MDIRLLLKAFGIEPGAPKRTGFGNATPQKRWALRGKGWTRPDKDQTKAQRKMQQASRKINRNKPRKT